MAATPGYSAVVKASGTSTVITTEATTDLAGAHTAFQITDATKRVLNPAVVVVVKKDTVIQSAALYTVNYLFGTITFLSTIGAGHTVTIDGAYLPMYAVATAKEFTLDLLNDLLDNTTFSSSGNKERIDGLHDAGGTLSVIEDLLSDYDSGGDSHTLLDVFTGRTLIVLETYPNTTSKFRAFIKFDKESVKAALSDMVQGSLSWKLAQYPGKQSLAFGT